MTVAKNSPLAPKPPGQECFIMLLGTLLVHPLALLTIRSNLKGEAAQVNGQTEQIRRADRGHGREGGGRDGVDGDDGQQA